MPTAQVSRKKKVKDEPVVSWMRQEIVRLNADLSGFRTEALEKSLMTFPRDTSWVSAETLTKTTRLNRFKALFRLFATMPVADHEWTNFVQACLIQMESGRHVDFVDALIYVYIRPHKLLPETWLRDFAKVVPPQERHQAWLKIKNAEAVFTAETMVELAFLDQTVATDPALVYSAVPASHRPTMGHYYQRAFLGNELAAVSLLKEIFGFRASPFACRHLLERMIQLALDQKSVTGQAILLNEPELLLLLKSDWWSEEEYGLVTSMLARVYDWQSVLGHEEISPKLRRILGDIGTITHNFLAWQFDAKRGRESLFCQYGFRRIPNRETDAIYGVGFDINPQNIVAPTRLDSKTLLEFRRAYILVSHPDYGTLVIRNSSPISLYLRNTLLHYQPPAFFGRDLMRYSAYYCPKALTAEDLETFSPGNDETLIPVLLPQLYKDKAFIGKLSFLMDELLHLKTDYSLWKFDSTAFEDGQFKGLQALGFKPMVGFLEALSADRLLGNTNQSLPSLAFAHFHFPPEHPYDFANARGEVQRYLPVTDDVLGELKDLANDLWTPLRYPNSDLMAFIRAGIQYRAELVMLQR